MSVPLGRSESARLIRGRCLPPSGSCIINSFAPGIAARLVDLLLRVEDGAQRAAELATVRD